MKRILMALAMVMVLLAPARATAQDTVDEAIGYMRSDGAVLMAARMDGGSASVAKAFVASADVDLIEESFDYEVQDVTTLTKLQLKGVNADSGKLFEIVDPGSGYAGGMLLLQKRANVFVLVNVGPSMTEDDGGEFALYAREVMSVGIKLATPPDGYVVLDYQS